MMKSATTMALLCACLLSAFALPAVAINRCGTSAPNAYSSCGTPCPRGIDSECPGGQRCYAGINCTPKGVDPDKCISGANPYSHKPRSAAGNSWNPQTKWMVDRLTCKYSAIGKACGTYPSGSSGSDHPGNADCEPGAIGRCPTSAERSRGKAAADWLVKNYGKLGISYVIWDAQIWSRKGKAWRPYCFGGNCYKQGACTKKNRAVTNGHYDHVHISMYPSRA